MSGTAKTQRDGKKLNNLKKSAGTGRKASKNKGPGKNRAPKRLSNVRGQAQEHQPEVSGPGKATETMPLHIDNSRKKKLKPNIEYSINKRCLNRELSWLQFNLRVLQEARDRQNPLMERLSFLAITASNLDEFFMVRVASLKDMAEAGYTRKDIAGLTTSEQLEAISEQTHPLVNLMYSTYNRALLPQLQRAGVCLLDRDGLSPDEISELRAYFDEYVYPILTPMAVDSGRPFPLIYNKSLNVCALLHAHEGESENKFVTIQVPGVIPRLYRFRDSSAVSTGEETPPLRFILLEDIIRLFLPELFPRREIVAHSVYRIMRNADLEIDEEEAADLLLEIERQVRLRRWGEVIRLEVEEGIDSRLLADLLPKLNVAENDIYLIDGPLDLTFLFKLRADERVSRYGERYYKPYTPQENYLYAARRNALLARGIEDPDIFALMREGSFLLHHPYDSFQPVLDFLRQAASDPQVLAIKQTLYRVSGDSPMITCLEEAARNGKQVLVLVELKARFDEEKNIHWARRLEKAGCHVIYGLVGLKTHSKITLVVRQEADGIRRYLHLGTGNYNDQTAKVYTDLGYMISTRELGDDAVEFFNMLSGFAEPDHWNGLVVAPLWLRKRFETLIRREMAWAKAGQEAEITAKMNSLVDEEMIHLLYEASQAGVRIRLIVRGICCLRPGVPGLSENISVRSLVGRYLEHARIYRFANGGSPEWYLSSADWMTRNLSRRVELMFPIYEADCRELVDEILELQLNDNCRAHIMDADGSYKKADRRGKPALDSQLELCRLAMNRAPREADIFETRTFEPQTSPDGMQLDAAGEAAEKSGGADTDF